MNTTTTGMFSYLEKIILHLERPPWQEICRIAIGFLVFPLCHRLFGQNVGQLAFWFFWVVLLGLRIVPLIVRRLLPFSEAAQEFWAEQRRLGKRYDSYQWQKLFWIGLGMLGYAVLFDDFARSSGFLAAFCLVTGGTGLLIWRRTRIKEIPRKL